MREAGQINPALHSFSLTYPEKREPNLTARLPFFFTTSVQIMFDSDEYLAGYAGVNTRNVLRNALRSSCIFHYFFCLPFFFKLQGIYYPFNCSRVMTREKQERYVEATSRCKRAEN